MEFIFLQKRRDSNPHRTEVLNGLANLAWTFQEYSSICTTTGIRTPTISLEERCANPLHHGGICTPTQSRTGVICDSSKSRTYNLWFRKPMYYPVKLQVHQYRWRDSNPHLSAPFTIIPLEERLGYICMCCSVGRSRTDLAKHMKLSYFPIIYAMYSVRGSSTHLLGQLPWCFH